MEKRTEIQSTQQTSFVSRETVEDVVRQIVALFRPRQIILFGSYAHGQPTRDSDVDLLVVMETSQRSIRAAIAIRQAIEHMFPLDILVRTPQQIRKRLAWGDSFLTHILAEGVVLYEASDEGVD